MENYGTQIGLAFQIVDRIDFYIVLEAICHM